ncbi:hypothetical protein EBT31_06210, partial [bacterium]|nr:hypothetical protein [bacterium]
MSLYFDTAAAMLDHLQDAGELAGSERVRSFLELFSADVLLTIRLRTMPEAERELYLDRVSDILLRSGILRPGGTADYMPDAGSAFEEFAHLQRGIQDVHMLFHGLPGGDSVLSYRNPLFADALARH